MFTLHLWTNLCCYKSESSPDTLQTPIGIADATFHNGTRLCSTTHKKKLFLI